MSKIVQEGEIEGRPISVNFTEGQHLYYFKLVGVGPNTLEKTNSQPLDVLRSVGGHLIVGTEKELREALHAIVDRALNNQFGGE